MGTPLPDKDDLLRQYRSMMRIRRFEEEAARNYAKGKIGGFLHLYIGQEAIAVGAVDALRDQDYVFQTYRDHGIALARGMGGSMHFFDVERNFLGGWAIVGGHMALAAGTAFKSVYNGEDRVTICFFGEGSTNIGGFHEAMSLAGLWKLPIVFVCENNQYAMGTPLERTSALKDLSIKAKGYAMVGDRFEGHDVTLVQERLAEAVDRARTGAGPTFIEVLTYRFRGHSMSDPAKYRSRTELEQRKQLDPIQVARERLLELGVEGTKLEDIDLEIDEEIEAAVKFAEESEPALREVMLGTVYAEEGDS